MEDKFTKMTNKLKENFSDKINKMEQEIEELSQKNTIMNTINEDFTATITELSDNLLVCFFF